MQVASVPLGLAPTQAPLISRSARSAKLPFIQKAETVVVVVEFARIQDYDERREGAYVRDELNIRANAPPPNFCLKVVCKKGRGVISGAYGTHLVYCLYIPALVLVKM